MNLQVDYLLVGVFLLYTSEVAMKIKAVLFDLGKTLIKYDCDSPEEIFQKILAHLGIYKKLQEIKDAFTKAENEAKSLNMHSSFGKIKCEEYWHKWDSLVLKHLGMANNEELAEIICVEWNDFLNCRPYPEVMRVLSRLKKKGLKVGLISTGYEAEINQMLEKANLARNIFDIIVGAGTIKKAKPSSDVFHYALNKLNVKPDEAIFVGDQVDADYNGAKAVGICALLIDREDKVTNDIREVEKIRRLDEIFNFVE